jgi:hypothetical protein
VRSSAKAAAVVGRQDDPAALLLAGWLSARLGCEVPVEQAGGRAPGVGGVGVSRVRVELTDGGLVELTRRDGGSVVLSRTDQPDSDVALPERDLGDLLAEEVRRLDADQPYAEALGVATGTPGLTDRPDEPRTLIWVDPMQSNGQPVAAQSSTGSPAEVASSVAGDPGSDVPTAPTTDAASTAEAEGARAKLAVERDATPGPTPEGAPGPPAEQERE